MDETRSERSSHRRSPLDWNLLGEFAIGLDAG
jgi:hypothetical protein